MKMSIVAGQRQLALLWGGGSFLALLVLVVETYGKVWGSFAPEAIPVRLAGENVTLQQLADRLSEALKDAGYAGKCSYYWLDDLHGPGFAIVTHIEHIQPDGKPVLDQRWGFDLPRYGPLTLGSLLGALMHADPGHYRLIALVASRQPLIEKDTPMTPDQVVILNKGPSWLGDSPCVTRVTFQLNALPCSTP
jgi:hypothetical protein